MARPRFLPDNMTLCLIAVVIAASLFPVSGQAAEAFDGLTNAAIALLFFMHGAKLSRAAIIAGMSHWRLHSLVFACTFLLFPLLGLGLKPVLLPLVGDDLYLGILFLCALPATVQSAIAFTSLARGNVAAAVCSAATSSLLGIFVTPLLVLLMIGAQAGESNTLDAIGKIVVQLLLPFIAGQIASRWIGGWVTRNKAWLKSVDQGSILLVVFGAFSHAVVEGIWQQVPLAQLAGLVVACCLLLALVLFIVSFLARRAGFNTEDRITILFAGSKKSLATGVPMAQVLFAGGALGALILPLMLFHQIQLMVCAVLAEHYARRPEAVEQLAEV